MDAFRAIVWDYYVAHARELPWRMPVLQKREDGSLDPYAILVSEIMLQQTQVSRVVPKYHAFLELFPTIQVLADAEQGDVLRAWSGLGYNRRARFLWLAAQEVVARFAGVIPRTIGELTSLPGVGKNTAGAIMAYAYNEPVVYIETNIRTVFIHHFFKDQADIPDSVLLPLVDAALPRPKGKMQDQLREAEGERISSAPVRKPAGLPHVRTWYWALMDYGSYLKSTAGNVSRASKHYVRQSTFQGSKRQLRGRVLRELGKASATSAMLQAAMPDKRLQEVLDGLLAEHLIQYTNGYYML